MKLKIEEIIKNHTDSIISGNIPSPEGPCPRCFEIPESFKLHECRNRFFRFIVGSFVNTVLSLLSRWKCSSCKRTFTDYPFFALPYKRYVLINIEELTNAYLSNDQTYKQTVSHEDAPIGYTTQNGIIDERQLAPSTLWHWNSFLGKMKHTLSGALNLIRQKNPNCTIFREFFLVTSNKYRSIKRKIILQTAMKMLRTGLFFKQYFNFNIFPRFALACGWI